MSEHALESLSRVVQDFVESVQSRMRNVVDSVVENVSSSADGEDQGEDEEFARGQQVFWRAERVSNESVQRSAWRNEYLPETISDASTPITSINSPAARMNGA